MEAFTETLIVSPKSIVVIEQPYTKTVSSCKLDQLFQGKILKKTVKGEEKEIIIKLLKPQQHTQQLLGLQDLKIKELEQQGKNGFLVKKTESDFDELSDLENGITVAAFEKETGQLIAQTSFSLANLKGKKCNVFPDTQEVSYSPSILDNFDRVEQLLEIKGTIVDSKFNGISLSQELINFGTDVLISIFGENKVVILSEVNKSNGANIHIRLKDNFKVLQEYKASDGVECYLLYKPLGEKLKEVLNFETVKSLYTDEKSLAKNSHVAQYTSHKAVSDTKNSVSRI